MSSKKCPARQSANDHGHSSVATSDILVQIAWARCVPGMSANKIRCRIDVGDRLAFEAFDHNLRLLSWRPICAYTRLASFSVGHSLLCSRGRSLSAVEWKNSAID
jgi:hypothetical protein